MHFFSSMLYVVVVLDPVHKPKSPKNLEAFFLETFLDAKPGRRSVRILANRIRRARCFAPMRILRSKKLPFQSSVEENNDNKMKKIRIRSLTCCCNTHHISALDLVLVYTI
jgi:hypothetical protein